MAHLLINHNHINIQTNLYHLILKNLTLFVCVDITYHERIPCSHIREPIMTTRQDNLIGPFNERLIKTSLLKKHEDCAWLNNMHNVYAIQKSPILSLISQTAYKYLLINFYKSITLFVIQLTIVNNFFNFYKGSPNTFLFHDFI